MQLKESIKNKICLVQLTPNYPLGEFVRWVEAREIDTALLTVLLDSLQRELEAEALSLSRSYVPSHAQSMCGYWCLYCAQVRAYYKAIIRDPDCKEQLSFLLQ